MAFSADGKRLASYSPYSTVRLWDVQTGRELDAVQISNFGGRVDLKRLADEKVWDAKARERLFSSRAPKGVLGPNWGLSPDGKHVAHIVRPGGPGRPRTPRPAFVFKLVLRDVQTGKELSLDHGRVPITSYAFSPDGKHLAAGDGREGTGFRSSSWEVGAWDARVKVWDAQSGQELLNLKGHTDDVRRLVYSPDGKRLASASWDKTIKVWDAHTGKELLTLKGHSAGVTGLTYSPDGKRLASTSRDKTVRVWDAQTGQELLTLEGHGGSVNGVAFSPDGHRLAAGAADGRVKIWDATPLPEQPKKK